MRDDLMAAQVPVDPGLGAASSCTADDIAVKGAGGNQVIDGNSKVEAWSVTGRGHPAAL